MKRIRFLFVLIVLFLFVPVLALPRDVPPIVSTDWLAQNLGNSRMVVLDIRNIEQYKKGHIPGALHTPFNMWAVGNSGLSLELPSDEALQNLLGKLGINRDSIIIIVNRNDTDYARADAARVAWTCSIAGVANVSLLDGGYNKWLKDNKSVSADIPDSKSSIYSGTVNRSLLASKNYVLGRIGKSIIVDTRLPEDYFGVASKPGHIKSAVNLPTPWIFTVTGVFKEQKDLQAMAFGVVGSSKSKEVIIYCGVGGYASTWWFLLTQMLGYQNVKIYDGSIEEWIKDPSAPVTAYSWH